MRVSVVIPTHNRRAMLRRALDALARQSYPMSLVEVIVVADGCSDGTEATAIEPPLGGRIVAQPRGGAAVARNMGAALATGDLLLFLDDDVEASPELIEGHVRAHATCARDALIVGYLRPVPEHPTDLFRVALRGWFDTMFERMRQPGHRFSYADVLTGNCSIPRRLFRAVGGFQAELRCHEDYELGLRVLGAGAAIAFAPDAGGWHQDVSDFARSLRRKREEGVADVWIARAHPQAWAALPLARSITARRWRLLRHFALQRPLPGRLYGALAARYARALARLRLRGRWRATRDDLLFYWYWRGVADALNGMPFDRFRQDVTSRVPPAPELPAVDLQHGLTAAMNEIDRLDAPGVVLHHGGLHVGTIPPQPWAEPLRGRHLPLLLGTTLRAPLSQALAAAAGLRADATAGAAHARVLASGTPRAS